MKQKRIIKYILITIGLVLVLSDVALNNFNSIFNEEKSENNFQTNLRISGFWDLTGSPIYIDDGNPSRNWLITASTQPWCSGSGIWTDPFIIENVTIDGQNLDSCIRIEHSDVYFIVRNCTLFNSGSNLPSHEAGIDLEYTNNGKLINNSCTFNHGFGISLEDCCNITITNNTINNNDGSGIILVCDHIDTNNNTILENKINHNGEEGIYLDGSTNEHILDVNHNNITGNILNFNGNNGIYIYFGDYNILFNNTANNNTIDGFSIRENYFTTFLENTAFNNTESGIKTIVGCNSIIKLNKLNSNENGICLTSGSDFNIVYENNVTFNKLYGIVIDTDTVNDNTIYNNTIIGNTVNGFDNGVSNQWDNGTLGNYWDDYSGADANDDGIGDSSYDVPPIGGSLDNYPIYEDGNDIGPTITINLPILDEIFGVNAPDFDITVFELYSLNTTWYTLDDGETNYTISEFTGPINQVAWDKKESGPITIKFYANDSMGYIGFNEVNIHKDITSPIIKINSPSPYQLLGNKVPSFNVEVNETNIHKMWYSIGGGENFTFTTNMTFNSIEWSNLANGTVIIKFFANDTL